MGKITWQFQASMPEGPALLISQPDIEIGAYDVASATITAGASNVGVVVQPSSTAGDVLFLAVSSDTYGSGLTYEIDGSGTAVPLDAPHVMLGAGAIGMMNGGTPPQKLTFSSSLATDAKIQVIAGRKHP